LELLVDRSSSEHLPALIVNHANLVAIYSRSKRSAQALLQVAESQGSNASNITIYSDDGGDNNLENLLNRADVAAVIISLPILVQPDVVRKCLAAGKHVLSEKPLAKDYETGAALVSEYETKYAPKGQVFMVGEQVRYNVGLSKARQLIQSGNIGELTGIHARVWAAIKPGNKFYETKWQNPPGYQGGFILDGGIHFVALIQHVAGQEITETKSFTKQIATHLPPMDTINVALQCRNGAQGCFSICLASNKTVSEFLFMGTDGTLTIQIMATEATFPDQFMGKIALKLEGKMQLEESIDGHAMKEEIKAFLQAISHSSAHSQHGLREALSDLAVVESICSGGGIVSTP
jgi:predicted dehydrogenase